MVQSVGGSRGSPARRHGARPASAKQRRVPPVEHVEVSYHSTGRAREALPDDASVLRRSDDPGTSILRRSDDPGAEDGAADSMLQGQIKILWQRVEDSQRRTDTLFGALASMDDRFAEARDEALARISTQGNAAIEKAKQDIVSTAKHFMERTALALQRHWREERVRQQDDSVVELACDHAAARLAEDLQHFEGRITDQVQEEFDEMRAEMQTLRSDGASPSPSASLEAQILNKVAMQMQDMEAQITQQLGVFQEAPILDKVALQLQDFEAQISTQLACFKASSSMAAASLTGEMNAISEDQQTLLMQQPLQQQPQEEPEDDDSEIPHRPSREEPAGGGLAAARGRRSREQALALSVDAQLQATSAQLEATDHHMQMIETRVQGASSRMEDQAGQLRQRADEMKFLENELARADEQLKSVTSECEKQSEELVAALDCQSEEVQLHAERLQVSELAIEAQNKELGSHSNVLAELQRGARVLQQDISKEEATNAAAREFEAAALDRMRTDFTNKVDAIATALRAEATVFQEEVLGSLSGLQEKTSQDITSIRSEISNFLGEFSQQAMIASVEEKLRASIKEVQDKLDTDIHTIKEEAVNDKEWMSETFKTWKNVRDLEEQRLSSVIDGLSNSLTIARAELDQRQAALEAQLNYGLKGVKDEIQQWVSDGNGTTELQYNQNQLFASVTDLRTQSLSDSEKFQSCLSALRAEVLGEIEAERGIHETTHEKLEALRRDFDGTFKPVVSLASSDGDMNVQDGNGEADNRSIVEKLTQAFFEWRTELQETRSRLDEALKGEEWCVETTQASLFVHQQKVERCLKSTSWARQEYEGLAIDLQEWIMEFRPDQEQIEQEFLAKDPVQQSSSSLREALRDVLRELGSWSRALHMLLRQNAADSVWDQEFSTS